MMKVLAVLIHGILTRQTEPSWPDQLDAWLAYSTPDVRAIKKEYRAGPFPRWNCLVGNPRLVRGLVAEVEQFIAQAAEKGAAPPRIWFIAHSNGAVIALKTARRLIARGVSVHGLILTGAACHSDLIRTGVSQWLARGSLQVAAAYCAAGDRLLGRGATPGQSPGCLGRLRAWMWRWLLWPYGTLGQTGWTRKGRPVTRERMEAGPGRKVREHPGSRVYARWFTGGHSAYFAPAHRRHTFRAILADLNDRRDLRLAGEEAER